jgi:hypothetical protein
MGQIIDFTRYQHGYRPERWCLALVWVNWFPVWTYVRM